MKTASITETKNQLSALLERVRNGESILILDRGRPVARLEPALSDDPTEPDARLDRLERQGLIRRAQATLPDSFLDEPPPRAEGGASISSVLIEERREGR
jgi:prevent-host-death family protein